MIVNKYKNGGGEFDPTQYYTKSQVDAEISGATEGLASEEYVDDAIEEALSGITMDGYWTSGETKSYVDDQISAVTDMMETKEEVIASALTELNETFDDYYTMDEVDAAIEAAISGISFDGYWTSAETKNYVDGQVSGLTEYIEDVERVAATALTELHTDILALSAATPDMSNYYTKSEVDAEITGATDGYATEAYVDDAISGLTDMMETKEEVIASALIDLNTNKVGSTDVHTIEKISQAGYDALVSGGTVDSYTLYVITGSTGN